MINQASLNLIKDFEGFRATTYRDPVGVLTIGYGTTAAAKVGISPQLGQTITREAGERYLLTAVNKFAEDISRHMTRTATANQFGAMVSLAYNVGPGAFRKSSVLRKFNAGDIEGAANAFLLWNKAGGKVLPGLVRRRAAERDLFLTVTDHVAHKTAPQPGWLARFFAALAALFGGRT